MANVLLLVLVAGLPPAEDAGVKAGPPPTQAAAPLRPAVKWVLDSNGKPVEPRDFERGLQTSGLVFREGELWSIGDQRAEWPGQLLRIDPATGRMIGGPVRAAFSEPPGDERRFEDYRSIRNPDFEGLTMDPKDPAVLYGVTEDKRMWIVRFRLSGTPAAGGPAPSASIDRITEIETDVKPIEGNDPLNYRFEGIALSDDGKTMYLAWERSADKLPRVLSLPTEEGVSGKTARPRVLPIDFAAVKPRADKPKALLNLNDIVFLRQGSRPCLLAVARDQERLLLIALEPPAVERVVDLDLRAPDGDPILWVSPEGLAIDEAKDRFWLITDPDSIRGNYRKLKDEAPEGNFAAFAPLLYEGKLSEALGSAGAGAGAK